MEANSMKKMIRKYYPKKIYSNYPYLLSDRKIECLEMIIGSKSCCGKYNPFNKLVSSQSHSLLYVRLNSVLFHMAIGRTLLSRQTERKTTSQEIYICIYTPEDYILVHIFLRFFRIRIIILDFLQLIRFFFIHHPRVLASSGSVSLPSGGGSIWALVATHLHYIRYYIIING